MGTRQDLTKLVEERKVKEPLTKIARKDEILKKSKPKEPEEEDPDLDLSLFRENPKYLRLLQHIDGLTLKTDQMHQELQKMISISVSLKDQVAVQEQECKAIETDQERVKNEIEILKTRTSILNDQKNSIEDKLDKLKKENAKLEVFILV